MGFLIHKFDGCASSGVSAAIFGVMTLYSSRNVLSDAGVKSLVGTAYNVDVPHDYSTILAPRRAPRFARRLLGTTPRYRKASPKFNFREAFPRRGVGSLAEAG